MIEIEKEMIAIIFYRDCGEKHRNNLKGFIFEMIYNKEIWEDWEISKEKVWDIKNSLKCIRYEAENNLKHWKKLYLTLTND